MNVVRAQLVAYEKDSFEYIIYVFKILEDNIPFGHHYVMCVRPPRWEHKDIDIGEIGYLSYEKVEAGISTYYDRIKQEFLPYNYTNIYFIKFVKEIDNSKKDIIL